VGGAYAEVVAAPVAAGWTAPMGFQPGDVVVVVGVAVFSGSADGIRTRWPQAGQAINVDKTASRPHKILVARTAVTPVGNG
jgi:hypothetical protein